MKFVKQHKASHAAILIGLILFTGGCASTSSPKVSEIDPYEEINRPVYQFNNKVDSYVAKPIADAYKLVTPEFMQKGVSNFFNNLQDINVILNDVLQAKFKQSAQDFGRLALNTTLGFLGVIDVASDAGLERHTEDFGQTLAVWGVPQGSYLVLPFVGPSTFREIPGYVVDTATNPANYMGISIPLASVSLLNTRANAEGALKFINEAAMDPYVFTREAFLQWRRYEASDGKVDTGKDMEALEADLLEDDMSTNSVPGKSNSLQTQSKVTNDKISDNKEFPMKEIKDINSTSKVLENKNQSYEAAKHSFEEANAKFKSFRVKNKEYPKSR